MKFAIIAALVGFALAAPAGDVASKRDSIGGDPIGGDPTGGDVVNGVLGSGGSVTPGAINSGGFPGGLGNAGDHVDTTGGNSGDSVKESGNVGSLLDNVIKGSLDD
ncbi:hypothetical protein MY5147_004483 [Beauveria neobassiana]|uniref:Uncharacterized protein n=3 Tax=Beauveria bassiana TaxID=176275 RepID=J4UUY6_BEAB2|nr:uncharacterized protein BBA_00736 [Beauveria bassiana ARSEF 2860]EJP69867.1 hypothetical protein BBA_00736 [Beauveria bassiana ARSEF 2860]KGQ10498.1 hypothetical protein BBAD15_g4172 [Beauveria bassiana D1-5]MCQ9255620.1 hypothetical protein [Vibrio parahaemolyticus]PQK11951.1 hypothetical protein BB8028_0003g05710 [Beauveria bassiana]